MEAFVNRQRGVALPIALIMLVVMLFTAIYLMRASNNATLMAGNLAYERSISRSADFGLSAGYDWLSATGNNAATKPNLNGDLPANGYSSSYSCTKQNCYRDSSFWTNAVTVNDPSATPVQYVIHRMCLIPGAAPGVGIPVNTCVQSQPPAVIGAGGAAAGTSLSSDADAIVTLAAVHYVITARVPGIKGASVINQMVVMIGQ